MIRETKGFNSRLMSSASKELTEFEVRIESYGSLLFSRWFKACALRAWAINQRGRNQPVTYNTDGENEVSKIFIISLRLTKRAEKKRKLAQSPQSWPITARVLTERYNKFLWETCSSLTKASASFSFNGRNLTLYNLYDTNLVIHFPRNMSPQFL